MTSTLDAALRSWPQSPWLLATLLTSGAIYWRGWRDARRRNSRRWNRGRVAAFWAGLATIYLALASPIETFSGFLVSVHMTQHMLLMMVAAPLLWLGAPLAPLLRGLPRSVRGHWLVPLFRSRMIRRAFARATHPAAATAIFTAVVWLWHAPPAYDLALRTSAWHYLQHLCFLGSALLFWYGVVRPYPARPRWSAWLLLPMLLAADVQNTLLSALLTFSRKPLYPYYFDVPRIAGLSLLEDQSLAGVIMWLAGSLAFLGPMCWIGFRQLYGAGLSTGPAASTLPRVAAPDFAPRPIRPFDLLRVPMVGQALTRRAFRRTLQIAFFALAVAIVVDGFTGPRVAAMNLAGVVPWIHWRGAVVFGLLVAGNVFCMGCPFLLPRTLARRFLPAGRSWPRWLRNKWIAVVLLAAFLWSYEAFSLWDSPRCTAWIVVGYFVAALAVDSFFRGASFCKYVCPIGQFNFVHSLLSPLEVKVREPDICRTCATQDCIRGSRTGDPGCELKLYQPRKQGNLDCTFCLDCVRACPHDNVGILAAPPGRELWRDSFRSGIGRFGRRVDVAALALLLVFGGFANAAGMVGPVVDWENRLAVSLGLHSLLPVVSLFYFVALIVLPLGIVGGAAGLGRRWGRDAATWPAVATRYAYAFVPLGFAMWLAHYSFHFFTSYETIVPATQRFAASLGWTALGEPQWNCNCCRTAATWLPHLEITFLDIGLLVSLYVGYRIARTRSDRPSGAFRALLPWAVAMALCFAAGVWIVLQPMQMRGTM